MGTPNQKAEVSAEKLSLHFFMAGQIAQVAQLILILLDGQPGQPGQR